MPAWEHDVDANVSAPTFPRRRLHEPQCSGFTCGVSCLTCTAQCAAQRSDHGHGSSPLLGEKPHGSLKTEKQAGEMNVHHLFPFLWRDTDGNTIHGPAHRPDTRIKPLPCSLHLVKQGMNLPGIANIRLKHHTPPAALFNHVQRGVRRSVIGVIMDTHVPPAPGELLTDRGSNHAGSTQNKHRWGGRGHRTESAVA